MISLAEADRLRNRIAELETKVKQYENTMEGILYCDDIFEFLVIARSEAMKDKLKDVIDCGADFYRNLSDKQPVMQQILLFFDGKTVRAKKDALRDYLRENPIFRTKQPEILLQRLKLTRNYGVKFAQREIPEHPIQDALDELNSQEEAPKDE